MKTSHTPGPWVRVGHRTIAADLVIDRPTICEVFSGGVDSLEEADANEALIAAAPDLLLMVKKMWAIEMNPAVSAELVALINKAEGRS